MNPCDELESLTLRKQHLDQQVWVQRSQLGYVIFILQYIIIMLIHLPQSQVSHNCIAWESHELLKRCCCLRFCCWFWELDVDEQLGDPRVAHDAHLLACLTQRSPDSVHNIRRELPQC